MPPSDDAKRRFQELLKAKAERAKRGPGDDDTTQRDGRKAAPRDDRQFRRRKV